MKQSLKIWLEAARPKTLPLALVSILTGSVLAYSAGHFSLTIAIMLSSQLRYCKYYLTLPMIMAMQSKVQIMTTAWASARDAVWRCNCRADENGDHL